VSLVCVKARLPTRTPALAFHADQEGGLLVDKDARGLIGLIAGLLLGVPASYFLQSGMLRAKLSLSAYLTHLPELLSKQGGDIFPPVLLSCVILGAVGWFVGRKIGTSA
jgi:hypothetical protein